MAAQENIRKQILRTKNTVCGSGACSRREECKPNVVIKCDGEEFVVSRSALCKFSKKFRPVAKQVEPNQDWEINITGASRDLIRHLLAVVQSNGDISVIENLSNEDLISVMTLAHGLEMTSIETELCFLIMKLSNSYDTIASLWDLVLQYHNDDVKQEIIRFAYDHIKDMNSNGFFRTLPWEKVLALLKLGRKNRPLDSLCSAIVDWLKNDPLKKHHLPLVARLLNWKKIPTNVICRLFFNEVTFRHLLKHSVKNYFWCPPAIIKALIAQFHQFQHQTTEDNCDVIFVNKENDFEGKLYSCLMAWAQNLPCRQLQETPSDHAVDNPVILVLGATRNNSLAIQYFLVKSKSWIGPVDINVQYRHDFGCTYWQKHLIILGGDRGDGQLYKQCLAVNISGTVFVTKLVDMVHTRCQPGVSVCRNQICVLGGSNEKGDAVSVGLTLEIQEKFHLWKPLKLMREKRLRPGVAVDNFDQLVVIGGHSCSCEYYSSTGWCQMKPLPSSYRYHGMLAVSVNHLVYAFRDYHPTEVCVFNMLHGSLKVKPTFGISPIRISSISRFANEFWALSPNGRFFIYYVERNIWMKTPLKTKEFNPSFFATVISAADLATAVGNEKTESPKPVTAVGNEKTEPKTTSIERN